ncbi:MAG: serine hydrolase [candidate division WOR-3 bacterium]|nr:MAG: serine hydrolase [candidate division WOR-3 bacterium]
MGAVSILAFIAILSAGSLAYSSNQFRQLKVIEDEYHHIEYSDVEAAALRLDSTGLDSIIEAEMAARHIPGVATCAIKNGQIVWSAGHGWANIEDSVEVADTTLFMLASISKTITAAAVMQLWEHDSFDLDDDINEYLAFEVHNPFHPDSIITFRHLLTHTSSINDNWSVMTYYPGDSPIPLGQYLADYLVPGGAYYDSSLSYNSWAPGSQMEYCNIAVALVGYLVEAIADSFPIWCEDSIFAPLDMCETGWFLANLDTSNVAMPYHWQGTAYVPYGHFGYSDYPAGQLRTSSLELARFLITFQQYGIIDTTRILDSATVALMTTVQYPQLSQHQGLVWYESFLNGRWIWGHSGGDQGVITRMGYCPAEGTAAIVLTNGESFSGCATIMDALFDYAAEYGIEEGDFIDIAGGSLRQNIPNPFSRSTSIGFVLSENHYVNLSVYNVAGQKVVSLVDAEMPTGEHRIVFHGDDLPGGVYYYRLQIDDKSQTKRCLLIK